MCIIFLIKINDYNYAIEYANFTSIFKKYIKHLLSKKIKNNTHSSNLFDAISNHLKKFVHIHSEFNKI